MMGKTRAYLKGLPLESEKVETLSINSQVVHGSVFLTGFVNATMKRKVVYQ